MRNDLTLYKRRLIHKQARFLKHLAAGLTTEEIAAKESITTTAVLRVIDNMRAEYGARNRAQLVHIAWQRGILRDELE